MKLTCLLNFFWVAFTSSVLLSSCTEQVSDKKCSLQGMEYKYSVCTLPDSIIDIGKMDSLYEYQSEKLLHEFNSDRLLLNPNEQLYLGYMKLKDLSQKDKFDEKLLCIQYLDKITTKYNNLSPWILTRILYLKSDRFKNRKNSEELILYLKKSLNHYQSGLMDNCLGEIETLYRLAFIYQYNKGDLDSALHYLTVQESMFDGLETVDTFKYFNYYSQASIYRNSNDYLTALNYANLALYNIENTMTIDTVKLINIHALRANVFYSSNKTNLAINDVKKAMRLSKMIDSKNSRLFGFYTMLLTFYKSSEMFVEFESCVDSMMQFSKLDDYELGMVYAKKANMLSGVEKIDSSILYYRKSLVHFREIKNRHRYYYSEINFLLSQKLARYGELDESENYGIEAVNYFMDNGSPDFELMKTTNNALRFFSNLANIYSQKCINSKSLVTDSLAMYYFGYVDRLIEYNKEFIDEDVVLINQSKMDAHYLLYFKFIYWKYNQNHSKAYLSILLDLINSSKGLGLRKNMLKTETNKTYKKYLKNIKDIEFLKFRKEGDSKTNFVLDKKRLLDLNNILADSMELSSSNIKMNSVQLLEKVETYAKESNSIVLDFFIPDIGGLETGYVFLTNGEQSDILPIKNIEKLLSSSNRFYQGLVKNSKNIILVQGDSLLTIVDNMLSGFITENTANLVVIPDHNLRKIPFEALKLNNKNAPYLIEKYGIIYGFSISSYLQRVGQQRLNFEKEMLMFSHSDKLTLFAEKNHHLSELPGSFLERKSIKQIYPDCDSFGGLSATKSRFLSIADQYSMIHLALHGKANSMSRHKSCIFFRSKKGEVSLYPHELIDREIRPELLFLSACGSADGKTYNHEGVYSIARAFYQSGARQVISSLWDLDDNSGSKIVKYFYIHKKTNLEQGIVTDLRQAKLSFLKEHKHSYISPTYWSSLILYQ